MSDVFQSPCPVYFLSLGFFSVSKAHLKDIKSPLSRYLCISLCWSIKQCFTLKGFAMRTFCHVIDSSNFSLQQQDFNVQFEQL